MFMNLVENFLPKYHLEPQSSLQGEGSPLAPQPGPLAGVEPEVRGSPLDNYTNV